jgi:hypothetical protein
VCVYDSKGSRVYNYFKAVTELIDSVSLCQAAVGLKNPLIYLFSLSSYGFLLDFIVNINAIACEISAIRAKISIQRVP